MFSVKCSLIVRILCVLLLLLWIPTIKLTLALCYIAILKDTVDWARVKEEDTDDDNDG